MANPTALSTDQVQLPLEVLSLMINKAKDASTVAALATTEAQQFTDKEAMVFTPTAEAEIVEEGAPKSSYDPSLSPVKAYRFTFQTTTRVSNQLMWADDDNQLQIVSNIVADQGEAAGRVLDYAIYHLFNPAPRTPVTIGDYQKLSEAAVQVTSQGDGILDMDALEAAVGDEYDVNGIALSRAFARSLRTERNSTGARLYPDIPMNLQAGTIDGVKASTSGTVSGRLITPDTGVLAFMGDFSLIRWGMVRAATSEVIEYGDPDGRGDLKRYNQVAYRTEGCVGFYVLDPKGFAVLKAPAQTGRAKAAK